MEEKARLDYFLFFAPDLIVPAGLCNSSGFVELYQLDFKRYSSLYTNKRVQLLSAQLYGKHFCYHPGIFFGPTFS